MSAYYCHRCDTPRCTSDCVPGEIYGELACEFCTDDFEMALEEYKTAAEVLERECKNCKHWDAPTQSKGRTEPGRRTCAWLNLLFTDSFGCNHFEGKL